MELKDIGAPLLGAVLGGPPGLAAGAISLVIKALGLSDNSSPQDIAKEIQAKPEAVIKLRELEVTYKQYLVNVRLQMDQAEYADRANARSREVEITKVTGKRDLLSFGLGAFVVLAFTVIIGTLIFAPPKKDDPNQTLINVLVGALAAGYSTVLGYYFGSSAGSHNKDQSINDLSSNLLSSNLSKSLSIPPLPSLQDRAAADRMAVERVAADRIVERVPAERATADRVAVESLPAESLAERVAVESLPVESLAERSGMPPEVDQLIQRFESCRLEAYPDPRSEDGLPITIGWGSTFYKDGSPIRRGDTITQSAADELYEYNCYHKFWKVLEAKIPHWQSMSNKQQAALCSFAYNLGADFYENGKHDTIDRCLRNRIWEQVPGAMMMYRNPGEDVEVGLGRRRRAEGLVWMGGEPRTAYEQACIEIKTPADCESLERQLKDFPSAMVGMEPIAQPLPRPNLLGIWMPPPGVTDFTIPVKHYTQKNNTGGRGYRECFKTSCTMLADYITKGKLSKLQQEQGLPEPEDVYQSYMDGDTIYAETHVRTLKKLGIDAYFTQTASIADVEKSLDLGIPVPIGVDYKDSGHWILVNGRGLNGWNALCPYGIRDGATNTWIQEFETEADARPDSFSRRLLKAIFTNAGDEAGWAVFVTAVDGISTGVSSQL